jgi:hypothetical protein
LRTATVQNLEVPLATSSLHFRVTFRKLRETLAYRDLGNNNFKVPSQSTSLDNHYVLLLDELVFEALFALWFCGRSSAIRHRLQMGGSPLMTLIRKMEEFCTVLWWTINYLLRFFAERYLATFSLSAFPAVFNPKLIGTNPAYWSAVSLRPGDRARVVR